MLAWRLRVPYEVHVQLDAFQGLSCEIHSFWAVPSCLEGICVLTKKPVLQLENDSAGLEEGTEGAG